MFIKSIFVIYHLLFVIYYYLLFIVNIYINIMVFITFIIPTIGRNSLYNSLLSLLEQTDEDWNCIVIFDGININKDIIIKDERIIYLNSEKLGDDTLKSQSGLVRNYGFKYINDNNKETEWIGFLDDDDMLSSNYISYLKKELELNKDLEVCIFRMAFYNKCILPSISDKNINRGKVGISFALKRDIIKNNFFENNVYEDFFYLKKLQLKKYKIIISSYVAYYVRTTPIEYEIFPKILLNFI